MNKWKIQNMGLEHLSSVYGIEKRSQETPWTKEIILQCLMLGYECKVLNLNESNGIKTIGFSIQRVHNRMLHLLNLCVDPDYQGQGYGEILLNDCFNSAQALKKFISEIVLEVRISNKAAIQLYKKKGFHNRETLSAYYQDDDKTEDAYVFIKKID